MWLRFAVVVVVISVFRDGLDLTADASANVDTRAGVEGLLALPLFVVVTAVARGGGIIGVLDSFLDSFSSVAFAVSFSFLFPLGAGSGGGTGVASSVSVLTTSGLETTTGSFCGGFVSTGVGRVVPVTGAGGSMIGVDGGAPLGLFEAADEGRCRVFSVAETAEF